MADSNLDLQLKISADNQAGPEVAKLTAEIDRLSAELAAQQGAIKESGKDWFDYSQQVAGTAESMVNIVSTVEDVLIKTAEIGTAVVIYQKWKTLVAGVEASYLTLKTAIESAVIGSAALANAGWDSTRIAADKLEVTVAKLAARFVGFAKIGEVLSLAGAALAIAQVGISANESNEKTRLLTEQIGGLTTALQQLDPQSRAVLIAKERFDALYKASLALGVSADDLAPQFKAFFDQTQSGNLSVKKSADILTDLAKTHAALRSTTGEVTLSQEALSAAFDTGFTSVSRLGEIFGAALNPALDAVAKQMGVSRTQLQQLIDTGRLGSEDVLPALAAAANNVTKPLQSAGEAADFSKQQFEKMGLSFYDLSASKLPGVDFALQHTAKEIALTADSSVDPIGAAVERIVNFGASVEDWARRVKLALSEAFTTGDWSKDWSNGLKEAMYGLDYLLVGLKEEFVATGESLGILAGAAVTATNPVDELSAVWSGMSDRLMTTRDRLNEYVNALEGVDNAEGRTVEATAAATEALKKLKDVPIPEALQELIDKLDSATTASRAVSKVWQELGALDLTGSNLRNLTVLMETIDQVSKKTKDATGTQIAFSQQLAEIPTAPLVGLLNKVQELAPLLKASGNEGVLMGTVLGAVFNKLGLDADEAGGKATQYGKDAAASFAALAASAQTSGRQVQAALEAALNGAKTQADIDLIIAEFNKLANAGVFSAQLIADGQAAIARSMEDLAKKIPGVADGFKTLGVESAAHLQALAASAELSFKQIKASATPQELRDGFLAWAEAAIEAATATNAVVPSAVRSQAAALGLNAALEELILKYPRVNAELTANVAATERGVSVSRDYSSALQRIAAAQIAGIQSEIAYAQAKGDTYTVSQKTKELAILEAQWAQTLAAAKQAEIAAEVASTQAKIAELQASQNITAAIQAQINALQLKLVALGQEAQAQALASKLEDEAQRQQELGIAQQQNASVATDQQSAATEQNTQATEKNATANRNSTGILKAMVAQLDSARSEMKGLSDTAEIYFDLMLAHELDMKGFAGAYDEVHRQQVRFNAAVSESDQELGKLRAGLESAEMEATRLKLAMITSANSFAAFDIAVAKSKAETIAAFNEQAIRALELTRRYEEFAKGGADAVGGITVTMNELNSATRESSSSMNLLDKQRLDQLNSAIEAANDKLREMQNEAQDAQTALAEMNAELLAEQGNTAAADRLKLQIEQSQKLAELEQKRLQAEREGNKEAAKTYAEMIRVQEALGEAKRKNLEADIAGEKSSTTGLDKQIAKVKELKGAYEGLNGTSLSGLHGQIGNIAESVAKLRGEI